MGDADKREILEAIAASEQRIAAEIGEVKRIVQAVAQKTLAPSELRALGLDPPDDPPLPKPLSVVR